MCRWHTADPLLEGSSLQFPCQKRPITAMVLLPQHTTGCSGRSALPRGCLSLGQQLASSTAQGFTTSSPDKNEECEALSPFLCPQPEALMETWVPQGSPSLPGEAGGLRRIPRSVSQAAGTERVKHQFRGGDPQVLSANPSKPTLLMSKVWEQELKSHLPTQSRTLPFYPILPTSDLQDRSLLQCQ